MIVSSAISCLFLCWRSTEIMARRFPDLRPPAPDSYFCLLRFTVMVPIGSSEIAASLFPSLYSAIML